MKDVIIVGAGLFGQVIARRLQEKGLRVEVLDAKRKGAGSIPAACLIRRGWLSSISDEEYKTGLNTLERMFRLQTIKFSLYGKKEDVYWVPPPRILNNPFSNCTIDIAESDRVYTDLGVLQAKHVIVATGIWTQDLVPSAPEVVGKAGMAFIWHDTQIKKPFIKLWAPYKHLVAFNIAPDKVWVGDGRTILDRNWKPHHTAESLKRCARAARLPSSKAQGIFGIRPYVKTKRPYYLKKHGGVWVATGGAKNGTLAAALCANELAEELT